MGAVARTQYRLSKFDASKVGAYSLVAMVKVGVDDTSIIANLDTNGVKNPNFKGAGIVKFKSSDNTFSLIVDGETFIFSREGTASSTNSSGYKLVIVAQIIEDVSSAGRAVTGTQSGSATRNSEGIIINNGVSYQEKTLIVDNLNARDHFAIGIMNSFLDKIEDPTLLSDAAISNYCQQAYKYAAYMMIAAANSRGTFTDETETSKDAKQEAIGELDSTTDKLINNLIVALERTDEKKVIDEKDVYFKRIYLPELQDIVTKVEANTTAINALKDNLTDALASLIEIQTQHLVAYNSMITQLSLIVASLQGYTQTMNNDIENVNNNVSAARSDIGTVNSGVAEVKTTLNTTDSKVNIIKTNLDVVKDDVVIIKQNTTP